MSEDILVTGGSGMVGLALKEYLPSAVYISSSDGNLCNLPDVKAVFNKHSPKKVIHLAAKVGGVKINDDHNVEFLTENLMLNTNVLDTAQKSGVERLLSIVSSCAFPFYEDKATTESDLHDGLPYPGNIGTGFSKRTLDIQTTAISEQFGQHFATITPATMYGPNDNFDIEDGHVIGSLIHKCVLAKENSKPFEVWGDGTAIRQFVFAPDAAKILAELLNTTDTGNIIAVSNEEVTIKELAQTVADAVGFDGEIKFTASGPTGLQRKVLKSSRFDSLLPGFKFTPLASGIEQTVTWFQNNRDKLVNKARAHG